MILPQPIFPAHKRTTGSRMKTTPLIDTLRHGLRAALPLALAMLLAACLLPAPTARAADAEILFPPDKTTLHAKNPEIHVVVRLKGGMAMGQVRLKSDGRLHAPQGLWPGQGGHYAHFRLPLKPGSNSAELVPGGASLTVGYRPLRSLLQVNFSDKGVYQFHRGELLPAACGQCHDPAGVRRPAPAEEDVRAFCFSCHSNLLRKDTWQHGPAVNFQCLSCHKEPGEPLKISIPGGKLEDLCYRCHINKKSWLQQKHVHGPVGTGDCTVCHNPHGDIKKGMLWAEGKDELCVACHTDKKGMVSGEKKAYYVHGIVKGLGCTACHDPHASGHRFQLYRAINDLCVSCHTGLKGVTRGHPVGGHPVAGARDPRRPDRPFTCTSCHSAHDSNFKYLLIGDILGGHICSLCHY